MKAPDNIALDVILESLSERKNYVPEAQLEYKVISERKYSKTDYKRYINYLLEKRYIDKQAGMRRVGDLTGRDTTEYSYTLTVEGRAYYLSGGFSPNISQKFKRFYKGDSGYGNGKWILTVIFTLVSIVLSIIAIVLKK